MFPNLVEFSQFLHLELLPISKEVMKLFSKKKSTNSKKHSGKKPSSKHRAGMTVASVEGVRFSFASTPLP